MNVKQNKLPNMNFPHGKKHGIRAARYKPFSHIRFLNIKNILKFFFAALAISVSAYCYTANVVEVGNGEDGTKQTGMQEIWHDPEGNHTLAGAMDAYAKGEFSPLESAGSTGLKTGAYWSHFTLRNGGTNQLRIQLEYVDHQLIALEAFDKSVSNEGEQNGALATEIDYRKIADLSLNKPFSHRDVAHNRFVFDVTLDAKETRDIFVKFSSYQMGFVFPSMRIWQPEQLTATNTIETSALAFLFGGFFLMSIFALVAGVATNEKMFYFYSVYSLSKIAAWATILGYTHQYLITDSFHWSFMSMSGAASIFCGLVFARTFLQSRRYTPRVDKILLFMMANAVFIFICALFKLAAFAIAAITVALLLYPVLAIVGIIRWRQGSTGALFFSMAWALLIFGLVVQAMRDMGFVPHNDFNYFWPPVASFSEMLTIMAAMGIKMRRLRAQKEEAEHNYRQELEQSKAKLEILVQDRTKELADAKKLAETEARTDALTGIDNRRSFFRQAATRINVANRKLQPLCILMMDIDHFKLINDQYGHNIGDAALLAFTRELSKTIRATDIFGRIGGEEFALLLDEDRNGALEFAERLRVKVENIQVDLPYIEINFTVSIGLAYLEDKDTVESLMRKADIALYKAKESGRNCVRDFFPRDKDRMLLNESNEVKS